MRAFDLFVHAPGSKIVYQSTEVDPFLYVGKGRDNFRQNRRLYYHSTSGLMIIRLKTPHSWVFLEKE